MIVQIFAGMLAAIRNVFLSIEGMVIHRPLAVVVIVAVVGTVAFLSRKIPS